jgi:hypothetical protein
MNNLKRYLKNNARARRYFFSELDFIKMREDNLARLNKLSKREEAKIYKARLKINEALKVLDQELSNLDYLGLNDEETTRLSLEALEELDLEKKQR